MVEIEHTIKISVQHHELELSLDEAIELKDALIRAVGAQTHSAAVPKEAEPRTVVNRTCHCGAPGWGRNGCCGPSGCNNVPA